MNCNQLCLSVCNVGGVHHLKVCVCVFVRPSFVRWMHMISVLCPIFFTWKHNRCSCSVWRFALRRVHPLLVPSLPPPPLIHHTDHPHQVTTHDQKIITPLAMMTKMQIYVYHQWSSWCGRKIRAREAIFFTFSKPAWVLHHLTVMIIDLFLTSVGNCCHTIASFVSRVLQTSFVRAVAES